PQSFPVGRLQPSWNASGSALPGSGPASRSRTDRPDPASRAATTQPAEPAPTTMTSGSGAGDRVIRQRTWSGRAVEARRLVRVAGSELAPGLSRSHGTGADAPGPWFAVISPRAAGPPEAGEEAERPVPPVPREA